MKSKGLLFIMLLVLGSTAIGQTSQFLWAKKYGKKGKNETVTGRGIDASGNVFVSGTYYDSTTLDGKPLKQDPTGDSLGVFIAKMNGQGVITWVKSFRGTRPITNTVMTVLDDGTSFLAGRFIGDLTIGTSSLNSGINDPEGGSLFLAKFDADGTVIWAKLFDADDAKSGDLEINRNGNILMTGSFNGTIHFGGSTYLSGSFESAMNGFVAQFDPATGEANWATMIESSLLGEGESVTSGPDGVVYVGGIFVDTLKFSPSVKFVSVEPDVNSPENAFVAKYDASGNFVWAKQITGLINAPVFLTFCNQNLYAAVSTLMTFAYDSENSTYGNYLVKINSASGAKVWMKKTSLSFFALESDGDSAIYYMNRGSLNYYFDAYSTTTGSGDLALGKLNADGIFQWVTMRGDVILLTPGMKARNKKVFMGGALAGFDSLVFEPGIALHPGDFFSRDGWYAMFNDNGVPTTPNGLEPVSDNSLVFSAFPNPAEGYVHVYCQDVPPNSHLFIMDVNGKVLRQQVMRNETENMDLSDLKAGVYLVKLANENGSFTQRIVLQ